VDIEGIGPGVVPGVGIGHGVGPGVGGGGGGSVTSKGIGINEGGLPVVSHLSG